MKRLGLTIVRFTNENIENNLDNVVKVIQDRVQALLKGEQKLL